MQLTVYHNILNIIAEELDNTDKDAVWTCIEAVNQARRIFVAAAGRSRLVASMFAQRLMHCGYVVHIVGETLTPSIDQNDLLIFVSGSGETSQLINYANTNNNIGSTILTVTANSGSTLGKLSNVSIQLGSRDRKLTNCLPLGSRFEFTAMIFLESVILQIMQDSKLTDLDLKQRHTNLE